MSVRWQVWQSELERLSPFSEEWNEGLPEEFIRGLEGLLAKKRAQREAVEKLAVELRSLRATYTQTLAFFDLERICQSWSADHCPGAEVERVLQVLEQWRGNLLRYEGVFPPAGDKTRTYASLRECCQEADEAMAKIRPGFGALHDLLAPPLAAPVTEQPAPATAPEPQSAAPEAGEPAAAAATLPATAAASAAPMAEAEPGIAVALGQISTRGVWLATGATGQASAASGSLPQFGRIEF